MNDAPAGYVLCRYVWAGHNQHIRFFVRSIDMLADARAFVTQYRNVRGAMQPYGSAHRSWFEPA